MILVGGASYTPLVSELLKNELNIVPQAWVDPSIVVAMGAAIEASKTAGSVLGPLLVDVTPHSLGTGVQDHAGEYVNHILIHRNTPLPAVATQIFYRQYSHTDRVLIDVNQGEHREIHRNKVLENFYLEGLKGTESNEILVRFELDTSGLLHVTAAHLESGQKIEQVVSRDVKALSKKANMAQLECVRIQVEERSADSEDDDSAPSCMDAGDVGHVDHADDHSMVFNQKPQGHAENSAAQAFFSVEGKGLEGSLSQEDIQLIARAQELIDSGELDQNDCLELQSEMAAARSFDKAALSRLADLLYYVG